MKNEKFLSAHFLLCFYIVFSSTLLNAAGPYSPEYVVGDKTSINKRIMVGEKTILGERESVREVQENEIHVPGIKIKELSPIGDPLNIIPFDNNNSHGPSIKEQREQYNFLYQITPYAATLSQKYNNNTVHSYYHIALEGLFTPESSFLFNPNKVRRASRYTIIAELVDPPPQHTVFKFSPTPTSGETSVTSGIEYGISGNITFPSAGFTPSFSVNHSRTHSIRDVEIECQILKDKVQWDFIINNLHSDKSTTSKTSISTFSPYVQWIWRTTRGIEYMDQEQPLIFKISLEVGFKEKNSCSWSKEDEIYRLDDSHNLQRIDRIIELRSPIPRPNN